MDHREIYWESVGFLNYKFIDEELQLLRNTINDIVKSPSNYLEWNRELAGNLEKEYKLPIDLHEKMHDLLVPLEKAYYDIFPDFRDSRDVCLNSAELMVDSMWVNFQKKYEFNPPHVHKGVFSFVIWLDIPYSFSDEQLQLHSVRSLSKRAGSFSFFYLDTDGKIKERVINADREYRNIILFFPAKLMHCVYPFYTTDEYRISVSGNIVYKN